MQLEIDVIQGRLLINGALVWSAGQPTPATEQRRSVRCLDLDAELVIGGEGVASSAAVLFDQEEFPDTILTSTIVKRFSKRTGVMPDMQARSLAVARFSWGEVRFTVDPRQGDLSMEFCAA